jgi:hypothetical protein
MEVILYYYYYYYYFSHLHPSWQPLVEILYFFPTYSKLQKNMSSTSQPMKNLSSRAPSTPFVNPYGIDLITVNPNGIVSCNQLLQAHHYLSFKFTNNNYIFWQSFKLISKWRSSMPYQNHTIIDNTIEVNPTSVMEVRITGTTTCSWAH